MKKETPKQVCFCEFCEIFRNFFFKEHLRVTDSGMGFECHEFKQPIVYMALPAFMKIVRTSFQFTVKQLQALLRLKNMQKKHSSS